MTALGSGPDYSNLTLSLHPDGCLHPVPNPNMYPLPVSTCCGCMAAHFVHVRKLQADVGGSLPSFSHPFIDAGLPLEPKLPSAGKPASQLAPGSLSLLSEWKRFLLQPFT